MELSYLCELVERGIGGIVGDEEPHALVGDLDCSGAVHVGKTALKNNYNKILLQKGLLAQKSAKTARRFVHLGRGRINKNDNT